MKLILRFYSALWLIILIIYSFGWSEINKPLSSDTVILILVVSAVSFFLSFFVKNINFSISQTKPRFTIQITSIVFLLYILNFIYAGYVPFISILGGTAEYVEFPGIPFVYALLFTFAFFYFFVVSYYFLITKKVKYLICSLIILLCFLLTYSRSSLAFALCGFLFMVILMNLNKIKNSRLSKKILWLVLIALFLLLVGFLFGCLGNTRHGSTWDDCSYIENLGKFTYYPSFLPKQYMWLYLYLTTPLANFNLNVINSNFSYDFMGLLCSFVPEFLSKRLFPDLVSATIGQTELVVTYFNAQSLFSDFYFNFGMAGCYIAILIILCIFAFISHLYNTYKITNPVPLILISISLILTFFYNIYYYSLPALSIIYGFCYLIILIRNKKKRVSLIRRYKQKL